MYKKFKDALAQLFILAFACLFISISYAGKPLWTFTPDSFYPPTVSVTPLGSAIIQYVVTNQSHKAHTLMMKPIVGVTQVTTAGACPSPFTLNPQQFCTLSLMVNGGALTHSINDGPVVCQQGNELECYQPAAANVLNITPIPIARYVVTSIADVHGTITPNSSQTVLAGSALMFSAAPDPGYYVDQWLVDGGIAQQGGGTFTLSNIVANHTVEVTFTRAGILYAGTVSGLVYFSSDNGKTWSTSGAAPSLGSSVNSLFATLNTLYVGSADGTVYYSTNNGTSWNATASVDGSAVNSVFVASLNNVSTIYVGTQNGNVYYSTNGSVWNNTNSSPAGGAAVTSLFISSGSTLYVGSEDGHIYYSTDNGDTWTKIHGPAGAVPIYSVFATDNQLYINTRQISSNSTLPPGTVDFEYAYSSNSLTDTHPTWALFSQITYTLFVNADASVIHAGTQDGYVFSLTTGDELGFITYSPISSLFFLG